MRSFLFGGSLPGGGVWGLLLMAIAMGVCSQAAGNDGEESQEKEAAFEASPSPVEGETRSNEKPRVSGLREWLELAGIDGSHFRRLVDRRPWNEEEGETLLRVLFRLPRVSRENEERWTRRGWTLDGLVADPEAARGHFYSLEGDVVSVEPIRPAPEIVRRYGMDRYYRCRLLLGESRRPVIVFARVVPEAWNLGGDVDERGGARGCFLKLAAGEEGPPIPVFAGTRLAWYPDTPLGNLGMDVGLLDTLVDRKPIRGRERESFYQMLAAVGRTRPGQLMREARRELKKAGKKSFSVVPLFNDAARQRGRLVMLCGTVRRAVRVRVDDADILARFGIDHYYEMALFTEDSQSNPLIFCVRELPEGMPVGDGPRYGEVVCVAGFFFKTWAFRSVYAAELDLGEQSGAVPRQLAPLLIGREPVWYPREAPADQTLFGAIAGGIVVLVLLGIWYALWRHGREDRRFREKTINKVIAPETEVALDKLEVEGSGEPDFRGLDREGP